MKVGEHLRRVDWSYVGLIVLANWLVFGLGIARDELFHPTSPVIAIAIPVQLLVILAILYRKTWAPGFKIAAASVTVLITPIGLAPADWCSWRRDTRNVVSCHDDAYAPTYVIGTFRSFLADQRRPRFEGSTF